MAKGKKPSRTKSPRRTPRPPRLERIRLSAAQQKAADRLTGFAREANEAALAEKQAARRKNGQWESVYSAPKDTRGRFLPKPLAKFKGESGLAGAGRAGTKKALAQNKFKTMFTKAGALPPPDVVERYEGENSNHARFKYAWRYSDPGAAQRVERILRLLYRLAEHVPGLLTSYVIRSVDDRGKEIVVPSYADVPQKTLADFREGWQSRPSGQRLLNDGVGHAWYVVYAYSPGPLFGESTHTESQSRKRGSAWNTGKRKRTRASAGQKQSKNSGKAKPSTKSRPKAVAHSTSKPTGGRSKKTRRTK